MRRTRGYWRLGLGAGLVPAVLLLQGAPADAVTETFSEPGADSFTVPTGICSVVITAAGGQGGQVAGTVGGVGASVSGRITVAPDSCSASSSPKAAAAATWGTVVTAASAAAAEAADLPRSPAARVAAAPRLFRSVRTR